MNQNAHRYCEKQEWAVYFLNHSVHLPIIIMKYVIFLGFSQEYIWITYDCGACGAIDTAEENTDKLPEGFGLSVSNWILVVVPGFFLFALIPWRMCWWAVSLPMLRSLDIAIFAVCYLWQREFYWAFTAQDVVPYCSQESEWELNSQLESIKPSKFNSRLAWLIWPQIVYL